MSFHTTIILGNVGKDSEMRYTPSGQAVSTFPVAVNEQYADKEGGQVKKTIWYRVTVWGKLAETCNQYVKKGMQVLCEGRLQGNEEGSPRIWGDPPRASFELTAQTVRFIGSKKQEEHSDPEQEEIPF